MSQETTFELMLFGTFEARVDGVSLAHSLSTKSKLLLAFLALRSGRPVATGVIADGVFPDSRAEDPHEIIKKTVQDTRRALGSEAYRLKTPAPRMLALDLEGATVDWRIFHAALKEGSVESLQHAVAVHSRPFLETEMAYWASGEQVRCLQLRQAALETLFRQAMDRKDIAEAGHRLSQQLAFEMPFLVQKEELWREFLQCLFERQEFGLLHYHYTHLKTFVENTAARVCELETQALYRQIPRAALLQILQRKSHKKKGGLPDSARLPNFPFALLGREEEIRELKEAFVNSRLVTVAGIGGVGKTRLAVQAGQEIATESKEEVGFLDLTPCTHSSLLQTVAATLGVKESVGAPLYHSLRDFLRPKQVLLVLDNCEHLIEAVALLCADLLRDCPTLRLLATSRETLRVDGEQVFALQPLGLPSPVSSADSSVASFDLEACKKSVVVRLFMERAATVRPGFQVTDQNVPTVIKLCRLVDGLPLGIEMIASQIGGSSLERIAADFSDCILHLEHRKRGIVPRHQTLPAVLDWSYRILSGAEQILLCRLSVFSGGWTLEGAEQVCSDDVLPAATISRLLSDLTSKSLVVPVALENDVLRFHFLETIRAYTDEQLRHASERERFQRRHLNYFVSLVEEAERGFSGKQQKEWLERIDSEYTNIRQALALSVESNREAGLRLGHGLGRYWEIRGYFCEGRDWCSALLAKTEAADRSVTRARLVDVAGWFCNIFSEYEKAAALLQESLGIFRDQGEKIAASISLIRLGLVMINLGDNEGARTLFEESLTMRRKLGDKRLIAMALLNLGIVVGNLAEYGRAHTIYEECLSLLQEVGDRRGIASCLSNLGYLAARQSEFSRAFVLYEESLVIHRDLGDKYLLRFDLCHLGAVAFYLEDLQTAFSSYAECLELSREAQVPFHRMQGLEGLANVAARQEQWERGVKLWGAAEAIRNTLHSVLDSEEQQLHDRLVGAARGALGEEAYRQIRETGYFLSTEKAVSFALESTVWA